MEEGKGKGGKKMTFRGTLNGSVPNNRAVAQPIGSGKGDESPYYEPGLPKHNLLAVGKAMMHVAFGVFANAKIQCEESVSSSTPQNRLTTNRVYLSYQC